ncbi:MULTISPECIES: tail protein X [unclassified Sphingobium]|uniref:tail protein X n=1 Tax=unclassified Sphingobium TaxID=2611147 RepID=UPI0022250E5C|nr:MULTISPECIES: tail protein X [unclassified Sphingobium]MCW2410883.1 phage tail protein X [Sphingobium sp. B8D3D]
MARMQSLTALQGDTVDALIWREAGLGSGSIGAVLDANPGLADLGPILPLGTIVMVPISKAPEATRQRPLTQLWD